MGLDGAATLMFGWILAGLALAFIVQRLIHAWLIDRVLDTVPTMIITGVMLTTFTAIWLTRNSTLMYAYVAVLIGLAGATQIIAHRREQRLMQDLRDESLAKYRAVIERDPKNVAAHVFIGDAYLQMGRFEDAIAAYETAIALNPEHANRERWKLRQAESERDRRTVGPPRRCPECGMENTYQATDCAKCATPLVSPFTRWLLERKLAGLLRRAWIPLLVVLGLIICLIALPRAVAGGIVVAGAIVATIYLLTQSKRSNS
jgi:tetratricopeptide (TPR) repeat protein